MEDSPMKDGTYIKHVTYQTPGNKTDLNTFTPPKPTILERRYSSNLGYDRINHAEAFHETLKTEKKNYKEQLSKFYKTFTSHPELVEIKRKITHIMFTIILEYNHVENRKINDRVKKCNDRDQVMDQYIQYKRMDKSTMTHDSILLRDQKLKKLKKRLQEIDEILMSIDKKKNFRISFYTLYRALRLWELYFYRAIIQNPKNRVNNTAYIIKPKNVFLTALNCLIIASKLEDYSPINFSEILRISKERNNSLLIKYISNWKDSREFINSCKLAEFEFLEALDYNVMQLSQLDILSNIQFIFNLSIQQFQSVMFILSSMMFSRRTTKFASVELVTSIVFIVTMENPLNNIQDNKYVNFLGISHDRVYECIIVVIIELIKTFGQEESGEREFEEYVADLFSLQRGIVVKDDFLEFKPTSNKIQQKLQLNFPMMDIGPVIKKLDQKDRNIYRSRNSQYIQANILEKMKNNSSEFGALGQLLDNNMNDLKSIEDIVLEKLPQDKKVFIQKSVLDFDKELEKVRL